MNKFLEDSHPVNNYWQYIKTMRLYFNRIYRVTTKAKKAGGYLPGFSIILLNPIGIICRLGGIEWISLS